MSYEPRSLCDILEKEYIDMSSRDHLKNMVFDTLMGLKHLESKKMIHRDIKLDNIMYTKSGRWKLADFGLAIIEGTDTRSVGGSYFRSPEMLRGGEKQDKSDIWALFVVILVCLNGIYWILDMVVEDGTLVSPSAYT